MLPSSLVLALATVALHSLLLCAVALLVGRLVRDPGRRSLLHRWAAIGAVPTAIAALTLGSGASIDGTGLGRASLGVTERGADSAAVAPPRIAAAPVEATAGATGPGRRGAEPGPSAPTGPAWILGAWATVAALWIGRDAIRRRRFVRQLGREPLAKFSPGGAALSASDALESPVVLGRREICVPRALWTESNAAERAAILAHEDAHIARRDPAWRAALRTVRALLWFQPLLGAVVAREAEAAELDCDERALRGGAEPLVLAQVLARVAESGLARPAPFPAMARRPALVVERVARLTSRGRTEPARGGALFGAGLACALALFACTAPSVDALEQESSAPAVADDAIVVDVDPSGRAALLGPGDETPRATVDLSQRGGDRALGEALAALVAESGFPERKGRPEGSFQDSFFIPRLRANPVHVRLAPDTSFSYVQQVMGQAAGPGRALWNIVVEGDARAYELPIPTGVGEGVGVEVRITDDAGGRAGRYGVTEARRLIGAPEREETEGDVDQAPALRWVDLAGLEETLRSSAAAGSTAVRLAPSRGTALAEVLPVLETIERVGGLQVVFQGSTR